MEWMLWIDKINAVFSFRPYGTVFLGISRSTFEEVG
jgi:hypothetical protein